MMSLSAVFQSTATRTLGATDDSDHLPLMAHLDLGQAGFCPLEQDDSGQESIAQPRFLLPMKKEQLLV